MRTKWIPCKKKTPVTPVGIFQKEYLVCTDKGLIMILRWCDGWNCSRDIDGSVTREHEIKDIVAWAELPKPYEEKKA